MLRESDPSSCDAIPTKEGALDGEIRNVFVLPYDSRNNLYEHFKEFCSDDPEIYVVFPELKGRPPCFTVFREVLAEADDKGLKLDEEDYEGSGLLRYVKLLGCKGSFPTCEICNKLNEMLRYVIRLSICFELLILIFIFSFILIELGK